MKKILTTPIKAEDLQDIRVGDVIYLTGTLCLTPGARYEKDPDNPDQS